MGYPMDYNRVICRNGLEGDYAGTTGTNYGDRTLIAGDLRRLEYDQVDANHLPRYAKYAGVSKRQAKMVLDAFFHPELLHNIYPLKWHDAPQYDVHGGSSYFHKKTP